MSCRRTALLWVVSGCVPLNSDERFDQDGDGVTVFSDCDDENPDLSSFTSWDGELGCGDMIESDIREGSPQIDYANCQHPFEREDLIWFGGEEHIWRFVSPEDTDVAITMATEGFLMPLNEPDTGGIAMIAFRGPTCELDRCTAALPIAPPEYSLETNTRPLWTPALYLHAQAGEAWYIVVSGGRGSAPSPYRLDAVCGG